MISPDHAARPGSATNTTRRRPCGLAPLVSLWAIGIGVAPAQSGYSTRISDPKALSIESSTERGYKSKADYILHELDLRPGDVVVDIGAGDGWWSERMAQIVGDKGVVHAAEVEQKKVDQMKGKFASIPQIHPYLCPTDRPGLPEHSCDLAFLSQSYHHLDKDGRVAYLKGLHAILKPDGRLAIIEKYIEIGLGEGTHGTRLSRLIQQAEEAGWVPLRMELMPATYHYLALFASKELFPQEQPKKQDKAKGSPPSKPAARPAAALKPPSWRGFQGEGFPGMRQLWDTPLPSPAGLAHGARIEAAFRLAEKHARQAAEAFHRSRRFVDGWLAHADPVSGLLPRNLEASRDFWNGRDSAADNWPFMVLTAAMTDRPLFEGRMLDMLRTETRLTCRVDRLPDDYSFSRRGWRREKVDLDAIIFDGAEYVKDGLLPIIEWLGSSPWSERASGIVEDIWKNARIETPFGKIPTLNLEVNGDLLQACSRLFWFTGERKYLEWALRLGDHYLLGTNHPTRHIKDLKLGDHSCEVINGLSELYAACAHAAPEKREAYRAPLHELYDRLLQVARNEHGLIYLQVNTRTGEHSAALTDNWGYNYDGIYTVFLLDGTGAYRDAVRTVLGSLKQHYTGRGGMCQSETADGYADSIEGAITLLNREPVESAMEWVDAEIRTMWGRQHPGGVIEGWHGDGNFARTSLMYALWKTQGVTARPWRADLRFGAARQDGNLWLSLVADQPWEGRLMFDTRRHHLNLHLPLDYPRINQFPEWFTVDAAGRYEVTLGDAPPASQTGSELIAGLPVRLQPGRELRIRVAMQG